jgi:hypothetical protein
MRISELLYRSDDDTRRTCTHTKLDFRQTPFSDALASALKKRRPNQLLPEPQLETNFLVEDPLYGWSSMLEEAMADCL